MDLTHFLAQFLGLVIIIFSVSMFVHKDMYMNLIRDVESNKTTGYVLATIATLFGLWLVFVHNMWYGGVLTIVVTLIGWVILLKGVLYLILPTRSMNSLLRGFGFEKNHQIYAIITLLIGIYLVVGGLAWY